MAHPCPPGGGKIALEAVPKTIQDLALTLVYLLVPEFIPKSGFGQGTFGERESPMQCRSQTVQEPYNPLCDVQSSALCTLQNVVILLFPTVDFRRYAVKTATPGIHPRQKHVGHRAADAAISIVEWVYADKPQMGYSSQNSRREATFGTKGQKSGHFCRNSFRRRSDIMYFLMSEGTRHDPHRCLAGSPAPYGDWSHTATSGWKKGGMPVEKTLRSERRHTI